MNLKSSKNLSKLVELHNLALKNTIQKNEKNLFNAINLIYKTLQKRGMCLFVEMGDRLLKRNIYLLNF